MAPSDYAAFLAWAAAALVVYAGADVANRRGWVRVDYRPKAAVMLLTGLAIQRAAGPEPGQSRVRQAVVAESAAGRAPMDEASSSVSLLVITVCITCLVLTACVAVEAARRGGGGGGGGGCRRRRRLCLKGGTLIGGGH
ncbi:hypothetical protein PVAP13_6KG125012, partial [Panicum virgatum]